MNRRIDWARVLCGAVGALVIFTGLVLLIAALATIGRAQTGTAKTVTVSALGQTTIQLEGDVPAGSCKTFLAPNYGCGGCQVPTGGAITAFNGNTGTLVYRPNTGFIGTDSFTFIVRSTVISGGTCSGATTDSSQTTVNVIVNNDKTTVTAKLTDLGVNAVSGKVVLVLGQVVDTPGATITPATRSVTATLDGTGRFTASVYPSVSLSPYSAYNLVYLNSATGRQEIVGVYDIPASSGTVDLATCNCRVIDAANQAKLMLATQASVAALVTQSRSWEVQDNGVSVGYAPTLNIIPGTGLSSSVTIGSGVANVTFNCAACTGGSLATSTSGRPAYYSANNVVSGAAFSGAHKIWGSNASATGMEWKSLTAGTGITITQTPGQYLIEATAQSFTLNSQTGATQNLAVGFSGGTQPAWNSSGNTHTLVLPPAAPGNTYGLVTNGAQAFAGLKEFQGGLTVKASGTLGFLNSGGTQQGFISELGIQHKAAAFGQAALGSNANLYIYDFPKAGVTEGHSLADFVFSLDNATASSSGVYYGSTSTLNIPQNNTAAHSQMLAGHAAFATQGSNSGGSAALLVASFGSAFSDRGTVTDSVNYRALGALYQSNVTNHTDFLAEDYLDTGSGALTNHYAFRAKYQTAATNKFSFYSDQGGSGQAAAPMSLGGPLDLRGLNTGNAPAVSDANNVRQFYNMTAGRWLVSENGGAYRNPLRAYNARNCSGATTLDFTTSQVIDCTLTGNVSSIAVTGITNGEEYTLLLRQNAGGTRTVASLGSNIKVNGGPYVSNSNTVTSNAVDVLKCAAAAGNLMCVYLFDVK